MNKYASTVLGAFIASISAAGPLALSEQKTAVIVWTGVLAACAYIKGKLEGVPGSSKPDVTS